MTEPTSDQKYFACLKALKDLEKEVGGKLSIEYVKNSSGKISTRYTLEYEEDEV